MKLIKILCLVLIVLSMCGIVSGDTWENGTLEMYILGSDSESLETGLNTHSITNTTTTLQFIVDDVGIVGTPTRVVFESVDVTYTGAWGDIVSSVGGPFYLGTNGINGTGSVYFFKQSTVGCVDIIFYFDEDYACNEPATFVLKMYTSVIFNYYTSFERSSASDAERQNYYDKFGCFIGQGNSPIGEKSGETGDVTFYNTGRFQNDYQIYTDYSYGEFFVQRSTGQLKSSSIIIKNETNSVILETGYSSSNTSYVYANESAYYYIKPQADGVEYLIYSNIADAPDFESVGTIELNQTSYIDPELIQIDATLTSYDFDNRHYYFVVDVSEDLDVWHMVSGSYNDTTEITSATESRTLQINTVYYDLPTWIRATLREYNPTTGSYTDVAYSTTVLYNPPTVYDYTLSGTVFNAGTGEVLEGATVSAVGPITTSATTSSTGRFTLYLAGGSYTITGSKSGFVDNVNEDIIIASNISLYNIYLTQTSYTNGTMNGIIKDADTGESLQDVHLIFTNATDRIDAYSSVGGYYTSSGFEQSTSYDIRAIKSGYYSYNGSVTIEASGGTHKSFDMVQINYSVTPTATVLDTYPDGEGHAWTNDEIITMLRIVVPGIFMMMFIFLLLAVLMGVGGNNGGNGGQGMGMKELWQR